MHPLRLRSIRPWFAVVATFVVLQSARASDYRWVGPPYSQFNVGSSWQVRTGWESWGATGVVPGAGDYALLTSGGNIMSSTSHTISGIAATANVYATVEFTGGASLTLNTSTQYGISTGTNAQLYLEGGTFNTAWAILYGVDDGPTGGSRFNGLLAVHGPGTTLNASGGIRTINANVGAPSRLQVANGAVVNAAELVHATNIAMGYDNYIVTGANSRLNVTNRLTFTNNTVRIRAEAGGVFDAGQATAGSADISTITLANGVFLGRHLAANAVTGYGVLGFHSFAGTIVSPSGAVDIASSFDVRQGGALVLSNAVPKFSGTISVFGGSLSSGSGASVDGLELTGSGTILGHGAVFLEDGGLVGSAGARLQASGGTLQVSQNGNSTFAGALAGTGTFLKSGVGALTLAGSASYTHTGTVRVTQGSLIVNRSAQNSLNGPVLIEGGGVVYLQSSHQIGDGSLVTMNGGALSVGGVETIGGLAGAGGLLEVVAGGSLTINQSADTSFGGVIGGTAPITKSGAGTLTLLGNSAYGGQFSVEGGKLLVNGSLSAAAVLVHVGAALGGSGSVYDVSVLDGALAPGQSAGNLTISLLAMQAGVYEWELAALTENGAGVNFDLLTVNGSATIGGSAEVSLAFAGSATDPNADDAFWGANRQWTILDASAGSLFGNFAGVSNSHWANGFFSLSSAGNQVMLNWTFAPVPEPCSLLLIAALGVAFTVRRIAVSARHRLRA
jgi:fibronectin-binding autotransporter adhesin